MRLCFFSFYSPHVGFQDFSVFMLCVYVPFCVLCVYVPFCVPCVYVPFCVLFTHTNLHVFSIQKAGDREREERVRELEERLEETVQTRDTTVQEVNRLTASLDQMTASKTKADETIGQVKEGEVYASEGFPHYITNKLSVCVYVYVATSAYSGKLLTQTCMYSLYRRQVIGSKRRE